MAERTWEYLLPTGEKLETRFDPESTTESVYLGPRLVSRSHGRKVGGHVVELMHGEAAGPFRGGTTARVVFDAIGPRCEVTVDDRPLEPSIVPPVAQPKDPPHAEVVLVGPPRRASNKIVVTFAVVALVGLAVGGLAVRRAAHLRAIGALPLERAAVTPNGMLRVHYSVDFTPTVHEESEIPAAASRDLTNVVVLSRERGEGGIVMIALPQTSNRPADLDARLAARQDAPWAQVKLDWASTPSYAIGECVGDKTALVSVREVIVRGQSFQIWACTFVRNGRGYRFTTWWAEGDDEAAQVYRRIVDTTDLL
jgi:hypothetical protein